jgi:jumonji domain-containing protein 7
VVVRPATLNMKFSELVDLIENVSDRAVKNVSAYLEYSSIPDHLPDLEDDIEEMPFINDVLKREHLNIWFSDGNTLGKLHFDQFDNFLCQVYKCINFVFLDY